MCGIHGFINGLKPEINSDDYLKNAFVVNTLRGVDSSGIAVVSPDKNFDHAKLPIAGQFFAADKVASKLIYQARQPKRASICHVRAATVGGVSYSNAHPFVLEDDDGVSIVGVHNGTLTSWKHKKDASSFDVDSEWALWHILRNKQEAFKDFTGAFCLVWWRSDDPEYLYMARNKERPMHAVITEKGDMAYGSEAGMVHWLCQRNSIGMVGSMLSLEEDKLYKFKIEDPTQYVKEDLPKSEVPASSYSQPSHYSGGYSGYSGNSSSNGTYYDNHTQKVKELFANLSIPEPPVNSESRKESSSGKAAVVSETEHEDAMSLGVLGVVGQFRPYGVDDNTGTLWGEFESNLEAGVFNAVMRDADNVQWVSKEHLVVTCLGVSDDGNELTVIVSPPVTNASCSMMEGSACVN